MAVSRKTITLFVYLPKEKAILLSRRGKLEKHAGLLQATVHGQIEPGEISQIAMKREFEEEVKGNFHQLTNIRDFGDAIVGENKQEQTFYHAAVMPDDLAKALQPTQEVSEIIHVKQSEVSGIKPYSKVKGEADFDYAENMVMFDDELEVLKKIFKDFA